MPVKEIIAQIDFNEVRNWILLILAVIGGYITIKTYISATLQRKLDNTYKTLDFLRMHIGEKQINRFVELFHANNELTGVARNEFVFDDGQKDTIENMFSEGGCGNGDIHNLIELFNLISPNLNTLETKIIWYEYGQIMLKIFHWTEYLEEKEEKPEKTERKFYSDFNKFMKKNWKKMLFNPTKHYTYAE